MTSNDRLLGLLSLLYAAPGREEGWATFLGELAGALGASGGAFVSHNRAVNKGDVTCWTGFAAEAVDGYVARWGASDPWAHSPKMPTIAAGNVCIGEQLVPHDEMRRTPYYNEFASGFDITHCLVGLLESDAHAMACLTLNGGRRHGPFDAHARTLLVALMPHLQRALQMHRRLVTATTVGVLTMDVLDRLPHALLLVAADGRVQFVNSQAARLLGERDGLVLDGEEIRTSTAAGTDALRAAIRAGASVANGEATVALATVRVHRPSSKRPYIVLVAPVPPHVGLHRAGQPAVLVAISDPDRPVSASEATLREMFALTPAEARLARFAAEGLTLREAARRLGWSVESARTQMKSVLAKTGTHRRAELVRLVLAAAIP